VEYVPFSMDNALFIVRKENDEGVLEKTWPPMYLSNATTDEKMSVLAAITAANNMRPSEMASKWTRTGKLFTYIYTCLYRGVKPVLDSYAISNFDRRQEFYNNDGSDLPPASRTERLRKAAQGCYTSHPSYKTVEEQPVTSLAVKSFDTLSMSKIFEEGTTSVLKGLNPDVEYVVDLEGLFDMSYSILAMTIIRGTFMIVTNRDLTKAESEELHDILGTDNIIITNRFG